MSQKTVTTPEREALRALVEKLDECLPHMSRAFAFAQVHGQGYSGPTFGKELEAARKALA